MIEMHNVGKVFRTDVVETHALRNFNLKDGGNIRERLLAAHTGRRAHHGPNQRQHGVETQKEDPQWPEPTVRRIRDDPRHQHEQLPCENA